MKSNKNKFLIFTFLLSLFIVFASEEASAQVCSGVYRIGDYGGYSGTVITGSCVLNSDCGASDAQILTTGICSSGYICCAPDPNAPVTCSNNGLNGICEPSCTYPATNIGGTDCPSGYYCCGEIINPTSCAGSGTYSGVTGTCETSCASPATNIGGTDCLSGICCGVPAPPPDGTVGCSGEVGELSISGYCYSSNPSGYICASSPACTSSSCCAPDPGDSGHGSCPGGICEFGSGDSACSTDYSPGSDQYGCDTGYTCCVPDSDDSDDFSCSGTCELFDCTSGFRDDSQSCGSNNGLVCCVTNNDDSGDDDSGDDGTASDVPTYPNQCSSGSSDCTHDNDAEILANQCEPMFGASRCSSMASYLSELESQCNNMGSASGYDCSNISSGGIYGPTASGFASYYVGTYNAATSTGDGTTGDGTTGDGTTSGITGMLNMPTGFGFPDPVGGIPGILANFLNWTLGIIGVFALAAFVVSGIQYFLVAASGDMAEKAKKNMMYSLIGITVAVSGYIIVRAVDIALNAAGFF